MDKISVIIPVYNTEIFFEKCLNSLLKQTYKNIEIIIVNDGSNKSCSEFLRDFSKVDKRIKLLHLQNRKGVGSARNIGIQNATGKFIYFLDSDDYLPPETLGLLIKHINDNNIIRGSIRNTYLSSSFMVIFKGLFNPIIYTKKRFRLFKNNSILNCLIRRDYIQKHNIKFNEEVRVFSDLQFIVDILFNTEEILFLREAVYFKRKRNDPYNNPALSQYDDEIKINDFLNIYNQLKDRYRDELVISFLDRQLLNYYRKEIIIYFKESKNINKSFKSLTTTVNRIEDEVIQGYDWILKREIKSLKSSNINKYKRISARHHFYRNLRNALKSKRRFIQYLYQIGFSVIGKIIPRNKKLLIFESFLGKQYSDNPRAIYEYMKEHHMDVKMYWSVERDYPKKPEYSDIKYVRRFSLRWMLLMNRAKYWVTNSRLPLWIPKPKDTVYIQTWHGTPLKRLATDMDEVHMPGTNTLRYKRNFVNEAKKWDYLISPNAYSTKIFKRAFQFEKQVIESGYPRNDYLINCKTKKHILQVKKSIDLPKDKKIILYAPTWRDNQFYSKGRYKFDLQLDLDLLKNQLGNDYIILLRLHYLVAENLDLTKYEEFVYDVSYHEDIRELYIISDLLITDYSSVFFDYANLKRPMLFYVYDIDEYRDSLRGFYFDFKKEAPGPLVKNTTEIIREIKSIDENGFKPSKNVENFYKKFCYLEDGHATERVVKEIFHY